MDWAPELSEFQSRLAPKSHSHLFTCKGRRRRQRRRRRRPRRPRITTVELAKQTSLMLICWHDQRQGSSRLSSILMLNNSTTCDVDHDDDDGQQQGQQQQQVALGGRHNHNHNQTDTNDDGAQLFDVNNNDNDTQLTRQTKLTLLGYDYPSTWLTQTNLRPALTNQRHERTPIESANGGRRRAPIGQSGGRPSTTGTTLPVVWPPPRLEVAATDDIQAVWVLARSALIGGKVLHRLDAFDEGAPLALDALAPPGESSGHFLLQRPSSGQPNDFAGITRPTEHLVIFTRSSFSTTSSGNHSNR